MKIGPMSLLILVMALWGLNFAFIRLGLNELPPFTMCTIRFILAAVPAVFFVKRPAVSLRLLLAYGIVMFGLQFSFLFTAIKLGMPPGLASLLMQCQVFFTLGLASYFFKEKVSGWKIFGAVISFSGLIVVAFHTEGDVTILGLIFTIMASFSWAAGNVISKKIGSVSPFGLVVWGSLVATPFLMVAALLIEGPARMIESFHHFSAISLLSIAYIVYVSTHVAYSLWSYFLKVYPISQIAPFTLLVPIFGFLGSALILDETFPPWKISASALLVLGLCIYFLESKFTKVNRES